jgi:hypothetical protein
MRTIGATLGAAAARVPSRPAQVFGETPAAQILRRAQHCCTEVTGCRAVTV